MNKFIMSLCLIALLFGSASRAMDVDSAALGKKLIKPVYCGDFEKVQELVGQCADLEVKDIYGDTPLICAARHGYQKSCKLLIESKAQLEANGVDEWPPLFWAASCGREQVCKLLIESKGQVNEKDSIGRAILMMAAHQGRKPFCEFLIGCKARVDILNQWDEGPLVFAIQSGKEQICEFLIDIMLTPIKQNLDAMVTFLGIKRKRRAALLCEIPYDVAKLIARQACESIKKEKHNVIAQIRRAQWGVDIEKIRGVLLEYVDQQLNAHKKVNH